MAVIDSQFLKRMMQNLPCGVVFIQNEKFSFNPVAEKILGYQGEDFKDLSDWFQKVYGRSAKEMQSIYLAQKAQGFPERITLPVIRKDGSVRHVSFSGVVEKDLEIWILFDESDSVEARRLLKESQERTEMILYDSKIGTYRVDCINGAFNFYWDELMFDLYKISPCAPSEVQKKWAEIANPEDLIRLRENVMDCLETGRSFNMRYRISWPNGEVRHMRTQGRVRHLDSGPRDFTFTGVVTDITDGVLTHQTLQEQQARLLHSAKMATLGEMSSGMAHEINNPLAVIRARAEQLGMLVERQEYDPNKMSQALHVIERMCDRITKIVKGLRVFARDGERDPFTKVSLKRVVEETLEFCREKFKFHQVQLTVKCGSEAEVFGRQVQLEQVLLNLLSNAYDAVLDCPTKWIHLVVSDQDSNWEISITDSGAGISAAIADRIMEPFFTTKEVGKGTGLGLSISSGIISEHGGKLSLDRDSTNTRFIIRLPKANKKLQVA